MDWILEADKWLLVWLNGHHSEWADSVMWLCSGKLTWLPLYLTVLGWIVVRERKNWLWMIGLLVGFGLAAGGADWLVHSMKHVFCRPRPTHTAELEGILHLVRDYRGGMYGFPSNHAADTAAFAVLSGLIIRSWKDVNKQIKAGVYMILTLYVVLNCYSRMYLGVHYPLDIAAGLAIGSGIAVGVYAVLLTVKARLHLQ